MKLWDATREIDQRLFEEMVPGKTHGTVRSNTISFTYRIRITAPNSLGKGARKCLV